MNDIHKGRIQKLSNGRLLVSFFVLDKYGAEWLRAVNETPEAVVIALPGNILKQMSESEKVEFVTNMLIEE